jgi:hypothetical protein
MFTSRSFRILFCSAMLLAASIVPASSKTPAASTATPYRAHRAVQPLLPPGAKGTRCFDGGAYYQCCTDSGFCCTWYGPGSPVCRYAP